MSDAIVTENAAAPAPEQTPAADESAPATAETQPMDQSAAPQASAPEQPQANTNAEAPAAKKEVVSSLLNVL